MIFRSPWPDIRVPSGSVCDILLSAAGQLGDKPAIIEGETGRTLTYGQLLPCAERVAAGLASAGIKPGQPLALALPNSIEFVLAWYGTLLAGGWVVPINPLYTPAEMEHQIRDSGARSMITIPECASAMAGIVETLFVVGGNWNELVDCALPKPDVRSGADDLAALLYSSGTTGKPKGVMLTHSNILANLSQLQEVGWVNRDDLIVSIFPLYHAAGLNCMLNAYLAAGATIVLMRRFDLEMYLSLAERYQATRIGGPPPGNVAINKSPLWVKFRLERARRAMTGAAPLGVESQQEFELKTGLQLAQTWGMTEGTAVIASTPDGAKRKLGSCGHLLPSSEAQVVDVGSGKLLGIGETGEIWLRGPNITQGYWKQPAANAETFAPGGWMKTGDIGYFDSDGCIFLVDRIKEMIKYNALQVAPAELEDVIQSHPAVLDVAVVGAPDPAAGEIPMAFVVRREGAQLEAEELMLYVAARVAPYKKIRAVEFTDQIPKSPSGKILRRVLKEKVRARAVGN